MHNDDNSVWEDILLMRDECVLNRNTYCGLYDDTDSEWEHEWELMHKPSIKQQVIQNIYTWLWNLLIKVVVQTPVSIAISCCTNLIKVIALNILIVHYSTIFNTMPLLYSFVKFFLPLP